MPMLLPPKVNGPVSVLSSVVSISGAHKGTTVQLLKNGAPIGTPDTADHVGNARIVVSGVGFNPGDQLTATQENDFETSSPSQFPETVMGVPTKLPPPIFLSQLHGCVDCVIFGGVIVGATVRVTHNNADLGFAVADGTEVTVSLIRGGALPTGAVLKVGQEVTVGGTTHKSPETPSLPLVAPPNREQMLLPPMIVQPVYECDTNVLVTGIRDGALMEVKTDRPQGNQYLFYGNDVRFSLIPLKLGEEVIAKQSFRACGMDSSPSAPVKAVTMTRLPSLRILPVVCPGSKQVKITDLVVGAEVTIYAGRDGSASLLGQATANSTTQTFDLPPTFPTFQGAPAQYLEGHQTRCNVGSLVTLKQPIEGLPSVPGAPTLPTMVECGRVVEVTGLVAGVTVRLTSDQADWPLLSAPLQATDTKMAVMLYRPLREGEKVTATATGCGAGAGAAATATVQPMSNLSAPKVKEPVRSWMYTVKVIDCVSGAQVHVYVNDVWRGRSEATSPMVEVFVGDIKVEDRLTALQCLCTKISTKSAVANVTKGKMRLKLQPDPVVRGAAAQSVTVHVDDKDDRHTVPSTVLIGGSTFPANSAFSWIFPIGSANPAVKVTAVDYDTENTTWPLVNPPPVVTTAPLLLQLLADAPAVIKTVNWTVYKQEVPPASPSQVSTASGSSSSVSLPKPTSGQIVYYVTCSVNFDYNGGNFTAGWVQHGVSTYPGSGMIGWSGTPLTGKFALQGAWVPNDEGGYDLMFWIYFWGVV